MLHGSKYIKNGAFPKVTKTIGLALIEECAQIVLCKAFRKSMFWSLCEIMKYQVADVIEHLDRMFV